MENTCLCCGKKIDGISWDLTNGCLCDDCYEEAKRCSSGKITHRNIRLYSGEEIKNIIGSVNNGEKAYSVVLHSANNHAFEVIKEIRELKSCDLAHAKGIVDNVPSIICNNLAKNKAEIILKAFENIGATVEIIEGTEIISKVDNNTEQSPVSTIPPKTESSSASNGTKYKLMLVSVGENREELASILNKLLGYDERKINILIAGVPSKITRNIDYCRACNLQEDIEKCGAKVQIVEMEKTEQNKSEINTTDESNFFNKAKKTFNVIKTIAGVILTIIILSLLIKNDFNFTLIGADFIAAINQDDRYENPYIQMVADTKPFNEDSYYTAFNDTFDSSVWSYFKNDDKRIVQVVSSYSDLDDKMITQFLVTPTENDQFLIEPYAMRVSGMDLSEIEMNIVIAAIFDGDLLSVLAQLAFVGSFIN